MDVCGLREYDRYISPDGEVYEFDNRSDRFLMSWAGHGMPPIEYVTQRGPYQHGESYLDMRLAPRIVQLIHRRNAGNRSGWWDNRADILNLVRPNRQAAGEFQTGVLRKVLPDGSARDLDVLVQQGPAFAPRGLDTWDEFSYQEEVRFIAGDPTFYDPEVQSVVWAVQNLGGLWFWDTAYPDDLFFDISFGTDVVTGQQQVHYTGTWLAYPTIEFNGPLNHPVVSNLTTGEKIEMTYNIGVGEQVTIALPFGNKSVTNNFGSNLVGTVTTDSDLATFHIAPEPEAPWCGMVAHGRPCGLNVVNVGGAGGVVGQTQVVMTYHVRYIGI